MLASEKFSQNFSYVMQHKKEPGLNNRVAASVGISATYLSMLKKRGKKCPTIDVAANIAEALDVPLEMLLSNPTTFPKRYKDYLISKRAIAG